MTKLQKTVLIVQGSKRQEDIWCAALASQGFSVISESFDQNLIQIVNHFKEAGLKLPDLLLIDRGIKYPNHYDFCRWCREHYPELKIILTSGTQKEISASERQWAIHQGAQDLLPGFQQETLLTGVIAGISRVLEVLDCQPIQQGTLIPVLLSLTSSVAQLNQESVPQRLDPVQATKDTNAPASSQKEPKDENLKTRSLKRYRGRSY